MRWGRTKQRPSISVCRPSAISRGGQLREARRNTHRNCTMLMLVKPHLTWRELWRTCRLRIRCDSSHHIRFERSGVLRHFKGVDLATKVHVLNMREREGVESCFSCPLVWEGRGRKGSIWGNNRRQGEFPWRKWLLVLENPPGEEHCSTSCKHHVSTCGDDKPEWALKFTGRAATEMICSLHAGEPHSTEDCACARM